MKHILKKLHFGGSSHDSARHGEIAPPTAAYSSSTPSPSSLSVSPSSAAPAPPPPLAAPSPVGGAPQPPWPDHRQEGEAAAVAGPGSTAVGDGGGGGGMGGRRGEDYYSSEEEYQMQLALAISASNSEFRDDPHNDQIRAATLLSLGKHGDGPHGDEERTPEALSRRYWDYSVLDYDERVLDGFYDVFALSAEATGHGKMPSLADLQTNIGDLGFEVIVVNRQIDNELVEMEQVVQCFSIDCQSSGTAILVQRIAELVMERMGGPVMDANDMLARWMERSTTMRTSLQTSLLPIGGVTIGLSRHRALLFKVLADKVGISCKLVKGSLSHYSGIDDDAVNIVRLENEREFLVDLMAAPGTLLPADVLNTKDTPVTSQGAKTNKSSSSWTDIKIGSHSSSTDVFLGERCIEKLPQEKNKISETNPWVDKAILLPSVSFNDSLPSSSRSSTSMERETSLLVEQTVQFLMPGDTAFECDDLQPAHTGVKENLDTLSLSEGLQGDASSHLVDMNSKDLFAELNPFQAIAGKGPLQFRPVETKANGYQRRRENTASGTGRSPLPLVWKNRSAFNEGPNQKYKNSAEGPFPRKNVVAKDQNASQLTYASRTISPGKTYQEISKIGSMQIPSSSSSVAETSANQLTEPIRGNPGNGTNFISPVNYEGSSVSADSCVQVETPLAFVRPSENKNLESDGRTLLQPDKEHEKVHTIIENKHDKRRPTYDRFLGTKMISKDPDSSAILSLSMQDRLDPMFDDVAECEIRWEDLVIGERIGLGSYGEVYRADWNGTEVAVKKFLDQDFYGDALDEFRSEVRIMRRLRHPNVVLFMGAVTRPPNLSIVTEFLPRGSLYRILHRPNCQIDQKRRIKMALDVAKGMNCLHTSTPTIVHRDLKSPNLLVDKNWNVKVCDFGLSRLKHSTFLSSKSTAGTPEWMAPEVLRNEQSNEKCDVYSFGVILWELATLRMPWSGMNPMQVVGAVGFQNRRLEIPDELDPVVARIIWECWQMDPNLRPSFAELMSALKPLQRLALSPEEEGLNTHLPHEIPVNSIP